MGIPRLELILALAGCGLLAVATGCRKPGGEKGAGEGAAGKEGPGVREERLFLSPVLVQKVERGEIRSTVSTTGSIVPARSQAIRIEEAGRIAFARAWREGDEIAEGELVATVQSDVLERELELNRRDVEIQKENLKIGDQTVRSRLSEHRTLQELYARGIAPRRDVDSMKLSLDQAVNSQRQNEINLAKAQAQVDETLARMARLELRAPFAGVVVSRATLSGEGKFTKGFGFEEITDYEGRQVSNGQVVCGVVDLSEVFMRCDVTSKDLGRVSVGQEADATIFAREDVVITGRVARISRSVNPETRAFEVDIALPNEGALLKPGMFGKADIVVERRLDTIAVDKSVVTRRNNEDVVFVAVEQPDAGFEVARMVPVTLGLESKEQIEVLSGLKTGDRVITRNFEVLQDNTRISAIDVDEPLRPGDEDAEESPAEENIAEKPGDEPGRS